MTRAIFAIGTTMTPTNVESLTVPVFPPKSTYSPYANMVELADGSMKGLGAPVASWKWGFLPQAQRDQLRIFCPGASAAVYIRTYTKDSNAAPHYFLAQMVWPSTSEETDTHRAIDFTIIFKQMVQQADP